MEGQTYRLKPFKTNSMEGGLDAKALEENIMAQNVTPSKTPQRGFLYRELNNPNVYYDENVSRMVMNYRAGFIRLAENANRVEGNKEKAKAVMVRMEETVPLSVIPMKDWRYLVYLMRVYKDLGDDQNFDKYASQVEAEANAMLASPSADPAKQFEPYQILLEVYDAKKDYAAAIEVLNKVSALYPNDPEIKRRIQMYDQLLKGSVNDTNKN
jgi:tetratricopeptide (TPR) repeat protein